MFTRLSNKKAQGTAEYAILIAIVVAAVIAMQTYVKRGLQAGIKFAVDKSGSGEDSAAERQYEPYYLQSSYNTVTHEESRETENLDTGGKITRTSISGMRERQGNQITINTEEAVD